MKAGDVPGARIVGGDVDRHTVIRLLDDEFLAARGRSGSLAWRLPDLFDDPLNHIQVVLTPAGDLAAACCCKRFAWRCADGRTVAGGMIGLVTTAPAHRGKGHGRRVVENASRVLADAGVEVATLWTTIPEFYAKLDWRGGVSGAYGPLVSPGGTSRREALSPHWTAGPFDTATLDAIETIRMKSTDSHVLRVPTAYRKLPSSTERLWLGQGPDAYVLVGEGAGGATLFEIEGESGTALALLDAVARRWPDAMANDRADGVAARTTGLAGSNLAMWLPLASGLPGDETWFVPYLDRI